MSEGRVSASVHKREAHIETCIRTLAHAQQRIEDAEEANNGGRAYVHGGGAHYHAVVQHAGLLKHRVPRMPLHIETLAAKKAHAASVLVSTGCVCQTTVLWSDTVEAAEGVDAQALAAQGLQLHIWPQHEMHLQAGQVEMRAHPLLVAEAALSHGTALTRPATTATAAAAAAAAGDVLVDSLADLLFSQAHASVSPGHDPRALHILRVQAEDAVIPVGGCDKVFERGVCKRVSVVCEER